MISMLGRSRQHSLHPNRQLILNAMFYSGSSILFTSSRLSNLLESSHQQFPPLPSNPSQFISTGVRQRPTLFGCNPTKSPPEFPLVLYLPNSPPINGDDPVTKCVHVHASADLLLTPFQHGHVPDRLHAPPQPSLHRPSPRQYSWGLLAQIEVAGP